MNLILSIAAGGALGALLRHFANNGITHLTGDGFPWGIFVINILGSFLMGALISMLAYVWEPSQSMKAFLMVGMLGAFTTFSTFSMDAVLLVERGAYAQAAFYIGGSVILSISALFAGMILVRTLAV